MAEYNHNLIAFYDGPKEARKVCRLVAVCESTQTTVIPNSEGATSPLVVRIRLENQTARRGLGTWVHSNGGVVEGAILPGENAEINISPNNRVALHQLNCSLRKEIS